MSRSHLPPVARAALSLRAHDKASRVRPGQRAFRWGSPRSGSLREEAAEAPPSAAHNPVHTTAILLIPLFAVSTIAVTCQTDKCETVGATEICTGCKAGGVPVDGFCWPPGSPQAAAAGCTEEDGAALDKTAATCEKCGDGYFLFMGGCYKTESQPGSEICTKASDGVCTACNTNNKYIFQNKATTVTPGSECILCSDATNRNGVMGVENCLKCQAPASSTGAATCDTCKAGFYGSGPCTKCHDDCATCSGAANNQCTSCKAGKYLKTDTNTCVEAGSCNGNTYADPVTRTCKDSAITDCTTCEYNPATGGPKCTACGNSKKVKTAINGATTCVTVASECVDENHFKDDGNTMCVLCSDTSGSDPNKGVAQCKTCTKSGAKPECKTCLEGYIKEGDGATATCGACHQNCAICSEKADKTKCQTCKTGFFLKVSSTPGECFACGDTNNGGIDGCAECDNNTGSLKCTKCKPNRKPAGNTGDLTCTEKTCEDETACGGTSGACDAIVIDANGKEHHYCSYCGEANKFPINGVCVSNANGNTGCTNNVCKSCTQGYFLYMGGCYSTTNAPGNYMCKTAANGVCTVVSENNKYFIVPEASNTDQSVLACGNPLGTLVDTKAYVGVYGCSQCTAPAAPSDGGMTAAICTSCDSGKKPNKDGSGCFACTVSGCSHCNRDDMCEVCSSGKKVSPGRKSCVDGCPSNSTDDNSVCVCNDGYSPDSSGTSCVSSGANRSGLSTGAIAGISVAVVVGLPC
ncbi:Variant-specific surface protein [Giardia duodenalis]|uniref:Variant-specific surface protein n=1 Tax=Giardia intestinalis TaxID=5741 RepID=V6TD30_GIAIN|nr:Variant-specific surface protein [Giardia intestinalis]